MEESLSDSSPVSLVGVAERRQFNSRHALGHRTDDFERCGTVQAKGVAYETAHDHQDGVTRRSNEPEGIVDDFLNSTGLYLVKFRLQFQRADDLKQRERILLIWAVYSGPMRVENVNEENIV